MGKQGLRRVGELSAVKAHYAAQALSQIPGVRLRYGAPFFKEFTLEFPRAADGVVKRLLKRGILGGLPLGPFDPKLRNGLLEAVTEKRTREEIDAFARALEGVLR
jgi:glycine dehydrogenase subunit 1